LPIAEAATRRQLLRVTTGQSRDRRREDGTQRAEMDIWEITDEQGLMILVVEVTGTSVEISANRIRRFLKPIRAIMLCSRVPVTLATEE